MYDINVTGPKPAHTHAVANSQDARERDNLFRHFSVI